MLDEKKLKNIISSILHVSAEKIDVDTSMDTIEKWDSLQHMNLVLALEDAFGISIPDDDAGNITSYPLIKLVINEHLQDTL
jgi:acyl carrier protein